MGLVGPFHVIKQFEGGGLGQLLHCRDAQGTDFAAKFPKDHSAENQQLIDDEGRRLLRHQGRYVVCYYEPVVHGDGRRGFAMELMEGSLAGLIAKAGALPAKQALHYFGKVARGLAEVHASAPGAFHGDIKLANVLYRGDTAKLADFGLARGGRGQTIHLGPHQGGTLGYLPPEGMASTVGDIYSLGVMLWAMLAGREPHPHMGPSIQQLTLQPKLHELLQSMIRRDPHQRPSIFEVLRQLPAVESEVTGTTQFTAKASSSSGLGSVIVGGFALAGIIGLASWIFGDDKTWDPNVERYRGPDGRFTPS